MTRMPDADTSRGSRLPASEQPEPVDLCAGPLTARFADGDLLDIAVGGDPVLDRAYIALRDQDWGTALLARSQLAIDVAGNGFDIFYRARSLAPELPFSFTARFTAVSDTLTMSMRGVALGPLLTNRIGFCLLHPLVLAGTDVDVLSADDPPAVIRTAAFPVHISPGTLFGEAEGLSHETSSGYGVTMRFTGDQFETEDQRNWIDGSYKTYCTPLRLPYPRALAAGETVAQAITIRYSKARVSARARPGAAAGSGSSRARVELTDTRRDRPEIGYGTCGGPAPLDPAGVELMAALSPSHLTVELDLDARWRTRWRRACQESDAVGAPLDVMLIAADGVDLDDWVGCVADDLRARLRRISVFDARSHVTRDQDVRRLRSALASRRLEAPVGGGSRAYFAELNRMTRPLPDVDFVTYTANPQVHATDVESIMKTGPALSQTVADASELGEGRPVVVGPITFCPRYNPVATSQAATLPPETWTLADERQGGPVLAAWAVEALGALATCSAATLFQSAGPHGIIASAHSTTRSSATGPKTLAVYAVLAWLAGQRGDLLEARISNAVGCLAARHADGSIRVLIASLSRADQDIEIALPDKSAEVSLPFKPFQRREFTVRPGAANPITATS